MRENEYLSCSEAGFPPCLCARKLQQSRNVSKAPVMDLGSVFFYFISMGIILGSIST